MATGWICLLVICSVSECLGTYVRPGEHCSQNRVGGSWKPPSIWEVNTLVITFISSGLGLPKPSSTSILNSVRCVGTILTTGLSIMPNAVTVSELTPSL